MLFNPTDSEYNPCFPDCPERSSECHGKCEKYLAYRAKKDRQLEEREKRNKATPDLPRKMKKHIWRELKKR